MARYREKRSTYNRVVKKLQYNDRNSTWDEILYWCDYDFIEAIQSLYESLKRVIEEDGTEGEELAFYVNEFNRVKTLMEVDI